MNAFEEIAKKLRKIRDFTPNSIEYMPDESVTTTDKLDDAVMITSNLVADPGYHLIAIDLDIPAALVPSSTPGHSHLYIDQALTWEQYQHLLGTLAALNIIEMGYFLASMNRKATALRAPGVEKKPDDQFGGYGMYR